MVTSISRKYMLCVTYTMLNTKQNYKQLKSKVKWQ
jgi:hypothetical protein